MAGSWWDDRLEQLDNGTLDDLRLYVLATILAVLTFVVAILALT